MILDSFRLDGKVAIVTGGTSGIGQAIAIALAEAGADVAAVGSSTRFKATRRGVEGAGRRFLPIQTDLSKMESVPRIIEAPRREWGRLDILVNNAGIIRRKLCIDHTEQDWDEVMQINLKAAFFLAQAAARVFIEQGAGVRSSISPRCSRSRAGFSSHPTPPRNPAWPASRGRWPTSGRARAST